VGDAHGTLGDHAAFFGVLERERQISRIIQSIEGSGDICSLDFFELEHQLTQIFGTRAHPDAIETSFQHVGFDTGLIEWGGPFSDTVVGVFTSEEIDLFESSSIGLYSVKAAYGNNGLSYLA